jgi:hypothetical protein
MANPARVLFFLKLSGANTKMKRDWKRIEDVSLSLKKMHAAFLKKSIGEMERKGGSQELGMRARGMSGRVGGKKRLAVCSGVERVVGISGVSGSGSQPASQPASGSMVVD